jgi:hypothetical protein
MTYEHVNIIVPERNRSAVIVNIALFALPDLLRPPLNPRLRPESCSCRGDLDLGFGVERYFASGAVLPVDGYTDACREIDVSVRNAPSGCHGGVDLDAKDAKTEQLHHLWNDRLGYAACRAGAQGVEYRLRTDNRRARQAQTGRTVETRRALMRRTTTSPVSG